MHRLIFAVLLIALLKTVGASGQELAAEPLRGRGDGTLPLGSGLLANDGTLPLRLGADGTLPLRLHGDAGALAGTGVRLPTQVVITQAIQNAMDQVASAALHCQSTGDQISKHSAQGTVTVGDIQYQLKGICYDHTSHNMELVAERRVDAHTTQQSFMIGLLPSEQPRQFQGRLTITGADTDNAGRYAFDVRTQDLTVPTGTVNGTDK